MTDKPKILVADDNKTIRNTLRRILTKAAYDVGMARDGAEALQRVSEWSPDLILLDVMMPKIDGMEVCQRIRKNQKYNFIYIIMLTARTEADDEIAGLDTGADDYITKPFDPRTLMARIRRGLQLAREKQEAAFDPLTKLYNRRVFEAFMNQETAKFKRYGREFSLILIDLDHFKRVNDTFGHKAGDTVLKEVAKIIQKETREADLPARWGGEELALLLPETDESGAKLLAEKLRQKIEHHQFPEVGHITASFGAAAMNSPESDLIEAADNALYRAKETGRNKVVIMD